MPALPMALKFEPRKWSIRNSNPQPAAESSGGIIRFSAVVPDDVPFDIQSPDRTITGRRPSPLRKQQVLSNKEAGWLAGLSEMVALPGIEPGFED